VEGLEMNISFWRGKRVFLTGHTGFKGSWMSLWLQKLGVEVTGFALQPPTNPSLFEVADVVRKINSFSLLRVSYYQLWVALKYEL
jgi:CDP-glucose 4,6-dehydratase